MSLIIFGTDSTKSTFFTICQLLDPIDLAASMIPLSIFRKDDSKRRAINGAAAIVKGTIAAVAPMDLPTIKVDMGLTIIIRMMKGKDLNILMIKSRMEKTSLFSLKPSFLVK